VIVRVRDYGEGPPQEIAGRAHSLSLGAGIGGMRERVRQLGYQLTVSGAEPGTPLQRISARSPG